MGIFMLFAIPFFLGAIALPIFLIIKFFKGFSKLPKYIKSKPFFQKIIAKKKFMREAKRLKLSVESGNNSLIIKKRIKSGELEYLITFNKKLMNVEMFFYAPANFPKGLVMKRAEKDFYYYSTGDVNLDYKISIMCEDKSKITGMLDSSTRQRIAEILKNSEDFSLTKSGFRITFPIRRYAYMKEGLSYIIESIHYIFKSFGNPCDPFILLKKNLFSDPVSNVRFNNLKILLKNYKKEPEINEILKKTVYDPDKFVSYLSALELGEDGIEILYKILNNNKPGGSSIKLKKNAILNIGEILGRKGMPELINLYSKQNIIKNNLQANVLIALDKLNDKRANLLFINSLSSSGREVKLAGIKGLLHTGDKKALPALNNLFNKTKADKEMLSEIQDAIDTIHTRLGPVHSGMLSMSESKSDEGALSISNNNNTGALSLEEEKES